MITHLEDARVHCVVLKVRAVPPPPPAPPATEKVLRKVTAEAASGPSGPNSVHVPTHSPERSRPEGRTNSRFDPRHPIKCSTHELPAETFALIRVLEARRLQMLLRKEVIQPHLPVRLPCYDLVLITDPTFDGSLQKVRPPASGVTDFHDLTGGVYKARERIHRSNADLRLLATPTSWGRVADPNPN